MAAARPRRSTSSRATTGPTLACSRSTAPTCRSISRRGTGVLLVEHHADLIFDICDRVTVLNLGKVLAAGTPAEIRAHREVVSAYLGALTTAGDQRTVGRLRH